jgi:hypothetical protein
MDIVLKCPACQRVVAPAFGEADPEAARVSREMFLKHIERTHGFGEVDGLLYFAEALRRHAKSRP